MVVVRICSAQDYQCCAIFHVKETLRGDAIFGYVYLVRRLRWVLYGNRGEGCGRSSEVVRGKKTGVENGEVLTRSLEYVTRSERKRIWGSGGRP